MHLPSRATAWYRPAKCEGCGREFNQRRTTQKYCSPGCRKAAGWRRMRDGDLVCAVEGCGRPAYGLTGNSRYCGTHRQRIYEGKPVDSPIAGRKPAPENGLCTIDGCERKHSRRGLCAMHYARERRKRK